MNPKKVVHRWVEAFNRQDVDALTSLYAADAVNFQVAFEPVHGKHAIRQMFDEAFTSFPDMGFEVENLIEDGDWAALEWRGWGTQLGTFSGYPATGERYELRGCGFFLIHDGLIRYQRGYFDRATWFKQIGVAI